jgi:hypothetical protein
MAKQSKNFGDLAALAIKLKRANIQSNKSALTAISFKKSKKKILHKNIGALVKIQ